MQVDKSQKHNLNKTLVSLYVLIKNLFVLSV